MKTRGCRIQASTLIDLLHADTVYPADSRVLEAGCGVGAQTLTLAKNSPEARFTSIDISEASVAEAKKRVESEGFSNVCFQQGDIFDLSFEATHSIMSLSALSLSTSPNR